MQLASFAFFTALYLRFLYRVRKYQPSVWRRDEGMAWYKDWRSLALALSISCVGILVRRHVRNLRNAPLIYRDL